MLFILGKSYLRIVVVGETTAVLVQYTSFYDPFTSGVFNPYDLVPYAGLHEIPLVERHPFFEMERTNSPFFISSCGRVSDTDQSTMSLSFDVIQ